MELCLSCINPLHFHLSCIQQEIDQILDFEIIKHNLLTLFLVKIDPICECQEPMTSCLILKVNSLWPSDTLWWHRPRSTSTLVNGLLPDDTKPLPEPLLTYHLQSRGAEYFRFRFRFTRFLRHHKLNLWQRFNMAFIEPMHHNKPNIMYCIGNILECFIIL